MNKERVKGSGVKEGKGEDDSTVKHMKSSHAIVESRPTTVFVVTSLDYNRLDCY